MSDFSTICIETERLTLRPLTPQDSEALLAIFSDEEVMRYWNTPPWQSLSDAEEFIRNGSAELTKGQSITLAIAEKASGRLIGKCMLFSYDVGSRRAEIGFGIGRPFWGRGYIQEAGAALIKYAFEELRLRRIEAEIDPENSASGKALERLGFRQEGLLRQRWEIAGVVSDSALYGLIESDWRGA